jgi:hypothetical protein
MKNIKKRVNSINEIIKYSLLRENCKNFETLQNSTFLMYNKS